MAHRVTFTIDTASKSRLDDLAILFEGGASEAIRVSLRLLSEQPETARAVEAAKLVREYRTTIGRQQDPTE